MTDLERLLDDVRDAFDRAVLAKLVLASPVSAEGPKNVVARAVALKAGPRLQLVDRLATRDVTRNLPIDEAIEALRARIPSEFRHVHLHTTERTVQLEWRKKGPVRTDGPPAHEAPPPVEHDRAKRRTLELSTSWLEALGIADRSGRAVRGHQDKLKQIHRFVEVLDHWLGGVPRPPDGVARWVDVGCGSGALTFAAWEYLRRSGFGGAEVVGVELRPALAAKAEGIARQLGCDGLSFVAADAGSYDPGPVDGVIALHACDTATDDALGRGVRAGARFLLVAPCCHKELRPRLAGPVQVLRHGILRTREAEIATDALRAALLEAQGYDARVFEFVSSEHTDKNLMIAATRRGEPLPGALDAALELARFYGVTEQRLAAHLTISLEAPT